LQQGDRKHDDETRGGYAPQNNQREEVTAAKGRLAEAAKVEISAEEYKLFKKLLAKHPELAGEVAADDEAASAVDEKVMNVLSKAMKIRGKKFESPDLFFNPDMAAYAYGKTETGGQVVFEYTYADVEDATWGCVVSPAMIKEMGMPSMKAFVDFLDKKYIQKEPLDYMLSREAQNWMATVNDR